MTAVTMYDDVNVSLLPAGATAYGAYINGLYANEADVRRRFPTAKIIRISVTATDHRGDCLDIENGDATNEQAPAWFKAVEGKTATSKPWLYTSASNISALVAAMSAAGIRRDRYFIWAAHYTYNAHICGPTCGYPQADGTQWTDKANGRSLDQSLIADYVLPGYKPTPPAKKPPVKKAAPAPNLQPVFRDLHAAANKTRPHTRLWTALHHALQILNPFKKGPRS